MLVIAEYNNTETGIGSVVHQVGASRFRFQVIDTDCGLVYFEAFYGDLAKVMDLARQAVR